MNVNAFTQPNTLGRFSRVFSKQSVHNGKATCDGFDQQAPRARTSFRTKNTRKWTNKMYKKNQIFGEKSIGEKSPYTNIGGRHVVSQDLTLSNKMCKCINFIRASHTCTQRRTCNTFYSMQNIACIFLQLYQCGTFHFKTSDIYIWYYIMKQKWKRFPSIHIWKDAWCIDCFIQALSH